MTFVLQMFEKTLTRLNTALHYHVHPLQTLFPTVQSLHSWSVLCKASSVKNCFLFHYFALSFLQEKCKRNILGEKNKDKRNLKKNDHNKKEITFTFAMLIQVKQIFKINPRIVGNFTWLSKPNIIKAVKNDTILVPHSNTWAIINLIVYLEEVMLLYDAVSLWPLQL